MKSKILMLTSINGFSGIDRPIFTELEKQWDVAARVDPFRVSFLRKYFYLAKSFSVRREKWRDTYHGSLGSYSRSPLAFHHRSKLCNRTIGNLDNAYDLIFQLSCMFIPWEDKPMKPYTIYLDRTIRMTERYFPRRLESMSPNELEELNGLVEHALNMADRVLTFSDIARDSVIDDYCVDCNRVITVGSGTNLPESPDIEKQHSNLVLTVCSDFERHRGQLSIDAFKLARERVPHARLVFVGRKLEGTGDRIISLPSLPYDRLIGLYARASIVVMPALLGGMQTITEAMASKCICIANAENPYISGLVIDKENGFLVSNDDPQEIADLVVLILKNKDLRESVGERAYNHIRKNFTWASVVSRISEHLKELV